MNIEVISAFVSGAFTVTLWLIGRFFWRFWKVTHDRFFILFAWAFWLLALERIPLLLIGRTDESRSFFFMIRLVGFALILIAIIDKNRARPSRV